MLRALILAAAMTNPATGAWADRLALLMLEETGCVWCARWDAEVGPVYERTEEGRRAPLMRQMLDAPLPDGVRLQRHARYSPTFVLLRDGTEVGRIEGYPGADFFYGLLQALIERADAPETRGEDTE